MNRLNGSDLLDELDELRDEYTDLKETLGYATIDVAEDPDNEEYREIEKDAREALNTWDSLDRMQMLKDIECYITRYSLLIDDLYINEYVEESCLSSGEVPDELPWYIKDSIDWKQVASYVSMDYTEIEFDGTTYYIVSN